MTDNSVSNHTADVHLLVGRKCMKDEFPASLHERKRRSDGKVWDVMFRINGRQRSRTFTRPDSATEWRDLYRRAGPRIALLALNEPAPPWLTSGEDRSQETLPLDARTQGAAPLYRDGMSREVTAATDPKAMFEDAPLLSTLSEAAVSLKVSRGHLLKLVKSGKVVGLKVGKAWMVPRGALLLRVEENRAKRSGASAPRREFVIASIAADLLHGLDDLADPKTVASLLRVSQRTLGDLTRGGSVPGVKEGTNWTYSSRELVESLISSVPARPGAEMAVVVAA